MYTTEANVQSVMQQTCSCTPAENYACANKVNSSDIGKLRGDYWHLPAKDKYLALKRQLIVDMIRYPDETIDFHYSVGEARVCGPYFSKLVPVCKKTLCSIRKEIRNGQLNTNSVHHSKEVKIKDSTFVMVVTEWMRVYFAMHGEPQPDKHELHLPKTWTKKYVFEQLDKYLQWRYPGQFNVNHEDYTYLYIIWAQFFFRVKIPVVCRFSQCDTCNQLDFLRSICNNPEELKQLTEAQVTHAHATYVEKKKYYKHMRKGTDDPEKYICMIIDGMTQRTTELPHFQRRPKWYTKDMGLEVHVVGAIIAGMDPRVEFSYTPLTGDDSNAFLSCLHRNIVYALETNAKRPELNGKRAEVLYIQLDNCSSNKSILTKQYLAFLAEKYGFRKVKTNYMHVGHTHENIDQMFSRFSVAIAKENIYTLDQLMSVCKKSFTPNPVCEYISHVYDFKTWLQQDVPSTRYLQDISFNHQFKTWQDPVTKKAFMQSKVFSYAEEWKPDNGVHLLSTQTPNGIQTCTIWFFPV
jgi:hypothetical protein